MVMILSCKFEKASYNIFFVRAATVKSLYTLRRWRNEAKSIIRSIRTNYMGDKRPFLMMTLLDLRGVKSKNNSGQLVVNKKSTRHRALT